MTKYHKNGIHVINAYGPTETTVCATLHPYKLSSTNTNIGRPISNTTCYVLDTNLKALPIGAIGELYIGGEGVGRGYLNQEKLTRESFIDNPFQSLEEKSLNRNGRIYKTGDLVRYLPDGNLEYIGRNDFQVKIRGYRIELGEIESKLSSYPAITQAVVLAKEQVANKYLIGYYVSQDVLEDEILRSYLSVDLPDYMVPSFFVHLDKLPLTINGKLDRKSLPEVVFTEGCHYRAPGSDLELALCGISAEVLGIEADKIGIDDDFFRLGGDSISSIQLVNRLRQRLGLQIRVHDIFTHRTIRLLT